MKKAVLFLILFSFVLLVSCKKDASQFQGMVRYVDSTGAYLPADSATITLHNIDTSAAPELTGYTNSEGIYLMIDVPDGIWVVKAMLQIDSNTTYIGITDKLEAYGKDFIAAPVDMIE